jgi:hypothetical protein
MKMLNKTKNFTFSLIISVFLSTMLVACSDDEPKNAKITFDHPHGSDVSNFRKHTFEHKFADQCVKRETQNSVNKKEDEKRFSEPCMCIATRIMRNLTEEEAEKFLDEKKNTQSLKMSFDEAAYFCLQKQAKPKGPKLFGKQ